MHIYGEPQTMNTQLDTINSELQNVRQRSRVLLEEMTVLLQWHSSEANRRQAERRSGYDRRLCADRRQWTQREQRSDPNPHQDHARATLNDSGRRRSDRRDPIQDRRLPLEVRQQMITQEMDKLGQRNMLLQRRRMSLISAN